LTGQPQPAQLPSGEEGVGLEPVLRNVIIHLNNEQPVVADLFQVPSPLDVAILCTNLRTPDGKRPVFIDQSDSTFLLPLAHIRFVEIPVGSDEGPDGPDGPGAGQGLPRRHRPAAPIVEPEADIEIDEDFLRKIRDA
jgi:hypothetical protein